MLNISKNRIVSLSRGDNARIPLFINKGTQLEPIRYNINDNPDTEIYFGIMLPGGRFEDSIIKKKYTKEDINEYGDVVVEFFPQDTLYMEPGKYFYTVKAILPGNIINTIIEKTEFWLM